MRSERIVEEWGDLRALIARHPGAFRKTKIYALLRQGKLRARKLGESTVWSLTSADELLASLPDARKAGDRDR
jgi:hypothetical protein